MNHRFTKKLIGDAIMALLPKIEIALKLVLEMMQKLQDLNQYLKQKNILNVLIGIGIRFQTLILATYGEIYRMERKMISEAVNIVPRLEFVKKAYKANNKSLVSIKEFKKKKNLFSFRYLAKVI
ncbi:MAG: hypothetical protein ACK4UJ_10050 [Leptonema sp. (in: bacteria)]